MSKFIVIEFILVQRFANERERESFTRSVFSVVNPFHLKSTQKSHENGSASKQFRQTDRQTDRQTYRQTDRHTEHLR